MANGAKESGNGDRLPIDPGEVTAAVGMLRDEVMAAAERLGRDLELERRMRENPMAVLGIAAGAGFLLGGGLWPVLRPFVRAVAKGMLSPTNLIAVATAGGARRAAEAEGRPGPASAG